MEDLFLPDFWAVVSGKMRNGQRRGQAIFNTAYEMFPEEVRFLDGSLYDPFYDDRKIPEFLERLADRLTRRK
jgi:hypothetical protein